MAQTDNSLSTNQPPSARRDDDDLPTAEEREQLHSYEVIIANGLQSYIEVGSALLAIRDGRLYRETHRTFEDYCRERWGMSARKANYQIASAEVGMNLGTIVPLPENEYQARPLTQLEPEQQREAWQVVQETAPNGKVTAAHVQSVVDTLKRNEEESVAKKNTLDPLMSSDSYEWYTPSRIARKAFDFLGGIELDPASSEEANKVIKAYRIFTLADDGLKQDWRAQTLWMNPPYGREIEHWVEKLASVYEAQQVEEALALIPARTDTAWFKRLRDYPRCFLDGRLKFGGAATESAAPFPSAIVYLGRRERDFAALWSPLGDVYVRVKP